MSSSHRGPGTSWDRPQSHSSSRSDQEQPYRWKNEKTRWSRQSPWHTQNQTIPEESEATASESEGKGTWNYRSTTSKAMPKRPSTSSSHGSPATAGEPFPSGGRATAWVPKGKEGGKGYYRERESTGSASRWSSRTRDSTESEVHTPEPWGMKDFLPMEVEKEEILLYPPVEFKNVIIECADSPDRNQTVLSWLTDPRFLRNQPNTKALKFLARILLGFMTRNEWIKYCLYFDYATKEFAKDDSHLIRYSKKIAQLLRHESTLVGTGDVKNAVDMMVFQDHMYVLGFAKSILKFVSCIVANPKKRFYAQIQVSLVPESLVIKVGAYQGHSVQSPLFDPSTTGRELRTMVRDLMQFGVIYHVTPSVNETSIKRMGLLADPGTHANHGRLAVHFTFWPKEKSLIGPGTKIPCYGGCVSYFQLAIVEFYEDDPTRQLYLTENGVILYYGNIPPRYLTLIGDSTESIPLTQLAMVKVIDFLSKVDDNAPVSHYRAYTKEELIKEAGLSSNDTSLGFDPSPGDMNFQEVKESITAAEEQIDLDISTSEAPHPFYCQFDLYFGDFLSLEKNSCHELVWQLLDEGYLYKREDHPDLGLRQRKLVKSDIDENEIWCVEWRTFDATQRNSLRNMGFTAELWKSTPFSGIPAHFLWTAWRAAKCAAFWSVDFSVSEDVRKKNINGWKNSDWDAVGFEHFREEEDNETEYQGLNLNWRMILEMFSCFFDSVIKHGRDLKSFHFGTALINNIYDCWSGERPNHEWVFNIFSSLRKHCDRAVKARNPLHTDISFDIDVLLKTSVQIEEMETIVEEERTLPDIGRNSTELEPMEGTEETGGDVTTSGPGKEVSESECGDTPPVSEEELTKAQKLTSWLRFLTMQKHFEWTKDSNSPLRTLDHVYGCTGMGLNDSHAFELHETECFVLPFQEHPHAHFQYESQTVFQKWDYLFPTDSSENEIFEILDCRVVSSISANFSKEGRLERDRAVKAILEEFHRNEEHVTAEVRRKYIFQILEAGFKIKELDFATRAKGFNSTTNLNILVGNFGNFRRSAKITYPEMSSSQFKKAVTSEDPSDNLLIRLLEGMSAHLVVLCESGGITDREFSYLENQGHFSYGQNHDKSFTVLIRGDNCRVKLLYDSLRCPYYQAYEHAKEQEVELPKMPNLVLPFAIFEVEFGTIGSGHQTRTSPSTKEDYTGDDWSMKAKRSRLYGSDVTTSVPSHDSQGRSSTEEVPLLSRTNMYTYRVCVFHAQNQIVSSAPARAAENFFQMWDLCLRFQCDLVAGDANMAGYRVGGSKQLIPNHKTSCFSSTLMYLVEKWNQESEKITGNTSQHIDVDFVSSNSISTLHDLVCFYNEDNRGRKLLKKEIDIPYEDWPSQDCIHAAILSYGHSCSNTEDVAELRRVDGSEFLLTVSEYISEIMCETLFLPSTDGDFHSPIWMCVNLPEVRHSGFKHSLKPAESRKRAHDTRKERQKAKVQEARAKVSSQTEPNQTTPRQTSQTASSGSSSAAWPKGKGKGKGKSKDKNKS